VTGEVIENNANTRRSTRRVVTWNTMLWYMIRPVGVPKRRAKLESWTNG